MLYRSGCHVKDNRAHTRHNAHQSRQRQQANLIADAVAAKCRDLREPTGQPP